MQDKVMEWLDANMNKNDMFYFEQCHSNYNYIFCYFKQFDILFCTFYRDAIEELLEEDK